MRKELNRRSLLVGCGLLTFSSAGIFFTGCGETKDKSIDEDKAVIENKDKTITISSNDLEVLKSKAYLEVSNENLLEPKKGYDKAIFDEDEVDIPNWTKGFFGWKKK